ncbi:MAG: type III deoxyribonuclease [Candidatus Levybacteria bacterium CG_4_10_14_0_8_um_filter_35_23]|nr:MAG: type III deoxyribonuclease [Candidatus Levybacteria bacterium CG_4_10_14_0_8_um_filter_35_23]
MEETKLAIEYDSLEKRGKISRDIPATILDNLNPKFQLREYQISAIARFIEYFENEQEKKLPIQLLFNMATGSGKTLLMVALMLYLYEKDYRHFIFFVDKTTIIRKTIDNFINKKSPKYLFASRVFIDGQEVLIKQTENFSKNEKDNINIHFTTISGLHSKLNTPQQDYMTFDDFKKYKTVFLSDEAHHINALTKNKLSKSEAEEKKSWEYTVNKLVNSREDNALLEFTATIDWKNPQVFAKYKDKVLMEYDLRRFREDKFSKDVFLFQSDSGMTERMLQAIIISQYRRKVAEKNRIALKPVLLMKSNKIDASKANHSAFIKLIKNLKASDIKRISKIAKKIEDENGVERNILKRAFEFFDAQKISDSELVKEIKVEFNEDRLVEVNSKEESEEKQILINNLEDNNNEIRVVFAVDMLNEGWDVLNLFDIIRLYGTRDSGKPTIQEAQLVGRGARYYPFELGDPDEKFIRKFDEALDNELRVIEQLHFHSIQNHRYIAELRKALEEGGIMRKRGSEKMLEVKDSFKNTRFYKKGVLWKNKRIVDKRENVKSIYDFIDKKRTYKMSIESPANINVVAGFGGAVIRQKNEEVEFRKVNTLPKHIIRKALDRFPFFSFQNLTEYFPHIKSIDEFITDEKYLGGITLEITASEVEYPSPVLFKKLLDVAESVKNDIKANASKYRGTKEFEHIEVKKAITDKPIIVEEPKEGSSQERGLSMSGVASSTGSTTGIPLNLANEDWYVYSDDYGTDEEKYLVKFIYDIKNRLRSAFKEVYLIRNQKLLDLYTFKKGNKFESDYVLMLGDGKLQASYLQLFIEPKGQQLEKGDEWKQEFLLEIKKENKIVNLFENDKYKIFGLPFFQENRKAQFKDKLEELISIAL